MSKAEPWLHILGIAGFEFPAHLGLGRSLARSSQGRMIRLIQGPLK